MGISSPFKDQTHPYTLFKKLLPYALYALFPIALLRLYLHPPSLPQSPIDPLPNVNPIIFPSSSSSFSSSPSHGTNQFSAETIWMCLFVFIAF